MTVPKRILPVIVFAQFCCVSLWFAGNGVMNDLVATFGLTANALGHLTSSVQFGFIVGTLMFAIFTIADRFSPSKVFFISALLGAAANLVTIWDGNNLTTLLLFRFLTGFFLAGIYPVGMKIAADYFEKGLGKSLSFLVGALVIGTAFPHLLKGMTDILPWKAVLVFTSLLALVGGVLIVTWIPDGPFRKPSQKPDLTACFHVFSNRKFRAVAFGYFGHMWELYAFWAFVPVILRVYLAHHPETSINTSLYAFYIIGIGGIACFAGGYIAQFAGTKRTAIMALALSGVCCLISPLMFEFTSLPLFVGFLFFWGMVVIADSPLFSTLVAQNVPQHIKGTALTIVNSIGFAITIVSIQLLNGLGEMLNDQYIYMLLALGPLFGLVSLLQQQKQGSQLSTSRK